MEYTLSLFVHKSLIGHVPVYINRLLTAADDVLSQSPLRDATKGNFVVPRTRLKLGEKAFSVAAPLTCNQFPTELKTLRAPSNVTFHDVERNVPLHCSNMT